MMDYKLTKLHDRKTLIKKNNIKFIKELIVNQELSFLNYVIVLPKSGSVVPTC